MTEIWNYIGCLIGFIFVCFLLFYSWKAVLWVVSLLREFRKETFIGRFLFLFLGLLVLGFIGSLIGKAIAWIFDLEPASTAFLGAVILPGIVLFNAWTKK